MVRYRLPGAYFCSRSPDVLFNGRGFFKEYLYTQDSINKYATAIMGTTHDIKPVVVPDRYDIRDDAGSSSEVKGSSGGTAEVGSERMDILVKDRGWGHN